MRINRIFLLILLSIYSTNLPSQGEGATFIKGLGYVILNDDEERNLLSHDIVTKIFYCKQRASCIEKTASSDIINAFGNYNLIDMIEIIRGDHVIKIYPSDRTRNPTSVRNNYAPIYINPYNARIVKGYINNKYVCRDDHSLRMTLKLTDYGVIFKAEKELATEEISIFNLIWCDKFVCKLINKENISGSLIFYPNESIYIKLTKEERKRLDLGELGGKFFGCGIWLKN